MQTSSASNPSPTPTVEYDKKAKTYWIDDPQGAQSLELDGSTVYLEVIQTNDLKRLQQVTPFTIIIPRYWPPEMVNNIPHLTKENDYSDQNAIDISIHNWHYADPNNPKDINITENNSSYSFGSNNILDNNYYVMGIQVTVGTVNQSFANYPKETSFGGYSFIWTRNGINYEVDIYGYWPESACKQIIESMFY
jgi:hypothetical protein